MLWMVLITSGNKTAYTNMNQRIFVFTLLWSLFLSLNSQMLTFYLPSDDINGSLLPGNLYNNLFQWSYNSSIIEIFTYLLFIILLISPKDSQDKVLEKGLSLIGIVLLLFINDYISFYVTLECQSLILYILASRDSISSGLKYFVIGSLSSAIILLGIVIIYSYSGITDISSINQSWSDINEVIWGRRLIILGILIKLGVPPFHQWNIEILSNTKTDLTLFFSTISKISLLYIIRLIGEDLDSNFSIFIIICLLLGSFMGLIQNQVKRLLAYSGIVHLGFFLLALMGNSSENIDLPLVLGLELPPIVFYIFQYFISLMIILIISEQVNAYYLHSFYINNFLMIILIAHLLSLSGFPPFIGFVAKWVILQITIGQYFLICLIAMLASVFSFFIYFNFIQVIKSPSTDIENSATSFTTFNAWVISFFTWSSFTMLFSFFQ